MAVALALDVCEAHVEWSHFQSYISDIPNVPPTPSTKEITAKKEVWETFGTEYKSELALSNKFSRIEEYPQCD